MHLEGEVDGGVEGPGDLDLRLAVAHPVVAEVELHVPRVGQPHHALHGGTKLKIGVGFLRRDRARPGQQGASYKSMLMCKWE